MKEKREKAFSSTEVVMLGHLNSSSMSTRLTATDTILRVLPIGLCLAAFGITVCVWSTNCFDVCGMVMYLIYANTICAGFSILSMAFLLP